MGMTVTASLAGIPSEQGLWCNLCGSRECWVGLQVLSGQPSTALGACGTNPVP